MLLKAKDLTPGMWARLGGERVRITSVSSDGTYILINYKYEFMVDDELHVWFKNEKDI